MGKLFYMRKAPHATHHCIDSMFWIQRRRLRVRVQRIGARMLRRRIEIHFRYFVRFSGLLMLRQWELIERWTIRVTEQIMFLCWRRTQIRFDDSVWHFVECHAIGECVQPETQQSMDESRHLWFHGEANEPFFISSEIGKIILFAKWSRFTWRNIERMHKAETVYSFIIAFPLIEWLDDESGLATVAI